MNENEKKLERRVAELTFAIEQINDYTAMRRDKKLTKDELRGCLEEIDAIVGGILCTDLTEGDSPRKSPPDLAAPK